MLQRRTIEPATLDLLIKLLDIPEFANFSLVGGTALALKYGHRLSVDLDLFSTHDFDKDEILKVLLKHYPQTNYRANNIGIFCTINEVKVDIVKHHYFSLIEKLDFIEGVRMFSDNDIMAMKIFAILKRAKRKDFFDLAELLNHYKLKHVIEQYKRKYPDHMLLISIPSAISYFDDAETDIDPISLNGQTWQNVKKIIQFHVREYLK